MTSARIATYTVTPAKSNGTRAHVIVMYERREIIKERAPYEKYSRESGADRRAILAYSDTRLQ